MKKYIFLFISCFTIGFISLTTGLCQTVTNGTFDGTATGWNNCGLTGPELAGTENNYGGTSSTNYIAEVDNGDAKGLCQTISGFTSGNSYTLSLNYCRRISGFTPSGSITVQVCVGTACTTFTASQTTWAWATFNWTFTAPASGSLQLKIATGAYDPSPWTNDPSSRDNYGVVFDNISFGSSAPVTLLNFKAVKNGNAVDLGWQTATEINNDYFVVEKSKNGVDFTTMGIVDGAGNSQNTLNYQTTDHSLYNGISYYRLKQVDYDGKYSYSKIVAVENEEMEITIYPNPSLGSFKVNVTNEKQPYSIEVTDAEGRLVFNKSVESSDTSLSEIDGLTKGVYIVHIAGTNTVVNKKLVVL